MGVVFWREVPMTEEQIEKIAREAIEDALDREADALADGRFADAKLAGEAADLLQDALEGAKQGR